MENNGKIMENNGKIMENNGKIMEKLWIKNQLYITFYIIFFHGSALLTLRVYRVLVSLQCNYQFLVPRSRTDAFGNSSSEVSKNIQICQKRERWE